MIEKNKPVEPKKKNSFLYNISLLVFMIITISFLTIGTFNLTKAVFTSYEVTTKDLMYLMLGAVIIMLTTCITLLSDIKEQNKTMAKGILHMLRKSQGVNPKSSGNISDFIKNMFPTSGTSSTHPDISGSISIVNMDDLDTPLFTGEFNNIEDLGKLREDMINQMLGSKENYKGRSMTKKTMLTSLSTSELESELAKAVSKEDWMWAASIRDEIALRKNKSEEKNEEGESGEEKKD